MLAAPALLETHAMTTARRYATYVALGAVGGALATLTAGLGYAIHDWQRAAHRTK